MPFDFLSEFAAEFSGNADEADIPDSNNLHFKVNNIFSVIVFRETVLFALADGNGNKFALGSDFGIGHSETSGIAGGIDQTADGGFGKVKAHLTGSSAADFILSWNQIARRTGNKHTFSSGFSSHIFTESTGIISGNRSAAQSGRMSGKRVRRIVADNVNGQVGFAVNKAKFAKLFICVFRCNRNDLSAVRRESRTVTGGDVTAVAVLIAFGRVEIHTAFAIVGKIGHFFNDPLFQIFQIRCVQLFRFALDDTALRPRVGVGAAEHDCF